MPLPEFDENPSTGYNKSMKSGREIDENPSTGYTKSMKSSSVQSQYQIAAVGVALSDGADEIVDKLVDKLGERFDELERLIRCLFDDAGRWTEKRTRGSETSVRPEKPSICHKTYSWLSPRGLSRSPYAEKDSMSKSSTAHSRSHHSKIERMPTLSPLRNLSKDNFTDMDAPVPGERDDQLKLSWHGYGPSGWSEFDEHQVGRISPLSSHNPQREMSKSTVQTEDFFIASMQEVVRQPMIPEHGRQEGSSLSPRRRSFFSRPDTETLSQKFHHSGSEKKSISSIDIEEILARMGPWKGVRAIKPDSNLRVCFDILSLVILLYDAITIPFIIAWDPDLSSPIFVLFWITPGFWTLDMCLGFFTGYYVGEVLEDRLSRTSRRYARTRFPIDLVVNSVDWFFIIVESGTTLAPLRVFKSNRLIRLLSLFRMARIWLRTQEFRNWLGSDTDTWHMLSSIIKLFFIILYLNHVIACIWFGLGVWGSQSDTGVTWLDTEDDLTLGSFHDASKTYQYATGLHWAMTQMTPGSMEVVPKNSLERLFNIMCLLNGLLFGTSLISQLSAKMIQLQLTKKEQLKNLMLLRRYIRQENISAHLGLRVINDVKRNLAIPPRLRTDHVPYLSEISAPLKLELRFELFSPHLLKDPMFFMFDNLDRTVMKDICLALDMIYLQPGEHLFHHGNATKDAYIVSRGTLQYTRSSTTRKSTIAAMPATDSMIPVPSDQSKSDIESVEVGVDEWISKVALWAEWTTCGTAIAVSQSDLIRVSFSRLSKAVSHHFKIDKVWEEYVKAFSESMAVLPGVLVNDLSCNVEMGDVVMKMPLQTRLMLAHAVFKYLRKHERLKWLFLSGGGATELEQEVRSGKCLLLLSEELTPERIAFLSALSVVRPDGKLLAQVATYKRGFFEANIQLPGLKREEGEDPADAIRRIITKRLHGLKPFSHETAIQSAIKRSVNACERQSKSAISRNFQISTKYLMNVYTLEIADQDIDWSRSARDVLEIDLTGMLRKFLQKKKRPSLNSSSSGNRDWSQGSMRLVRDHDCKDGIVYAWLAREDFDHLSSHSDDLNLWVGQMTLDYGCASN